MIEAEAIRRVLEVQQHPAVTYTPTPGFQAFVEDDYRWILLRAANQVGKTLAAAWVLSHEMISRPGIRARVYAPNREMSRQVIQRYVHDFVRHHLARDNYRAGRGFASNTITLRNGSVLQFRSYEDHPQTGAGDQLHLCVLDEVPKESHYREAVARVTRHGGRVIISCTPVDRPVQWFRDIIEPPLQGDRRAVWIAGQGRPAGAHWKQYVVPFTRDNVPWLSEEAFAQQIDLVSSDPTQAAQRLEGAWEGVTRSRLFTSWATRCAVSRPHLDGWRYCLGIDHGEMAGNQVALLCAWRGSSLHVVAEYRDAASVDYEQDARGILELMTQHSVNPHDVAVAVGDTNRTKGGRRVNEVIQTAIATELGSSRPPFRIEGANKRAGSVDFARRIINYALQRGDLTVDPRCTYLVSCLAGYRGIDTGDDKALSHGVAALRYIASRILAESATYRELRFR